MDIDQFLRRNGTSANIWSVHRPRFDLEYTDDTLLLSLTTTQMQSFLNALESQAEFYGMSLNQTKTEILIPEGMTNFLIKFRNETLVPATTQIKYRD